MTIPLKDWTVVESRDSFIETDKPAYRFMTPDGVYLVDNWTTKRGLADETIFVFYRVRKEDDDSTPAKNIAIRISSEKIKVSATPGVFPVGLELAQARLAEILDLELRGVVEEKQIKRKSKRKPLWTKDDDHG